MRERRVAPTLSDDRCSLAAGLIWDRISILIERQISTTDGAGEGSCGHAEQSLLNDARMVTRLVSPLSPLFFLHRQKCCSLHEPSNF